MKIIDNLLISLVERQNTPSVQYIILNTESIIHQFSCGLADLKKKKITDENTSYNGYSVTKTFTALAVLQLVEKGKLDLDDAACNHLPDCRMSGFWIKLTPTFLIKVIKFLRYREDAVRFRTRLFKK
jgi:CubicO group peptidase (beta-lactamase class C family)